jgi:hypothetical protein
MAWLPIGVLTVDRDRIRRCAATTPVGRHSGEPRATVVRVFEFQLETSWNSKMPAPVQSERASSHLKLAAGWVTTRIRSREIVDFEAVDRKSSPTVERNRTTGDAGAHLG